jgi:hypothetical protein
MLLTIEQDDVPFHVALGTLHLIVFTPIVCFSACCLANKAGSVAVSHCMLLFGWSFSQSMMLGTVRVDDM